MRDDIPFMLDRQRALERAGWLACVLLGGLSLWLFVQLAWALVPRGEAALDAPPARVTATDAGAAHALSVSKWHLFGSAPQPAGSSSNAPATTLSMTLRGTLAEADPKAGIAIIADQNGSEHAWRCGETLAGGVQLAEVYPDHVVLLHDGVQEVMHLPRDLANAGQPTSNSASGAINPLTGTAQPRASQSGVGKIGPMQAYTPPEMAHGAVNWQKTVENLRDGDSAGLADRLQIVPVLDNGKLRGVRVSAAGQDAALITKLGLRPSDVLTAVNGMPLDDIAQSREAIDTLRKAGRAKVTVLRDGKLTDIEVSLK